MKFIELRVNTGDFCLEILLVRVATMIELGNHEIFKQNMLKFDILINSHIVYSNIWSPYLVAIFGQSAHVRRHLVPYFW